MYLILPFGPHSLPSTSKKTKQTQTSSCKLTCVPYCFLKTSKRTHAW